MRDGTRARHSGRDVATPGSTRASSTSTASCPGSSSTSAFSSWPRTSASRCSSASSSSRSTSNLDEFYMVRVAGPARPGGRGDRPPQGRRALRRARRSSEIAERDAELGRRHSRDVEQRVRPGSPSTGSRDGSRLDEVRPARDERPRCSTSRSSRCSRRSRSTPGPVPYISNLSLSIGGAGARPGGRPRDVRAREGPQGGAAALPRRSATARFVPLEEVIAAPPRPPLPRHGDPPPRSSASRATPTSPTPTRPRTCSAPSRTSLRRRRFGEVVRSSSRRDGPRCARYLIEQLRDRGGAGTTSTAWSTSIDLWRSTTDGYPELRDAPWLPVTQLALRRTKARRRLRRCATGPARHHPYDSFAGVVERFIDAAADDPDVLAIKMTLYRTSDDSPWWRADPGGRERQAGGRLVGAEGALRRAQHRVGARAGAGRRARRLRARGLKTHAKALLVVRREGDGLRRYVHLGTGNYHP